MATATPTRRLPRSAARSCFEDDGPSIDRSVASVPILVTDDTDTPDVASASFAGLFDSTFGADGPKDADDNDITDADAITIRLASSRLASTAAWTTRFRAKM